MKTTITHGALFLLALAAGGQLAGCKKNDDVCAEDEFFAAVVTAPTTGTAQVGVPLEIKTTVDLGTPSCIELRQFQETLAGTGSTTLFVRPVGYYAKCACTGETAAPRVLSYYFTAKQAGQYLVKFTSTADGTKFLTDTITAQ
ncbi:hypothetical protein [Hymenobacter coccineus]|uniref:GOLD domain-containing protein n=1 Tax=Hymenobacter coccineus TaxID=1908235 RepID=A0A1G1TKQ9_9BACT|nr:hypothetical protein [Hymenobacter coccineus]OGX91440.1 hypothetical protein BEN49_19745 [Hymenobacter coccineus]